MNENIRQLQKINLQTLELVLKIIDKYNLKYYMLGGTMLGAIRHKGFIPWDDDIDIGMPRKDYEKFLEIANQELSKNYKIINFKTDKDYNYYITRVQNINTKLIELRFKHEQKYTHASIDIFPLDGFPNNFFKRKIYYLRILSHRAMMSLENKKGIDSQRKRGGLEKVVLKLLLLFPTDRMFNSYNQKIKIDRLLKRYDMADSLFAGNIMGAYRVKEVVPTKYYGDDSFYKFEHLTLRGFKEKDKYLRHLYGDSYMELPPEQDRKIHFEIVDINITEKRE